MVAPDRFIGCTDHGTNLYLCGGFSILEHQHRLHCNFHYGSSVHIFAANYLDRHHSMVQSAADFCCNSRNFSFDPGNEPLPSFSGLQRTRRPDWAPAHRYFACHDELCAQRNGLVWCGECHLFGHLAIPNGPLGLEVSEYRKSLIF